MRRTRRMETVSYQRGHIGRRLTAIRGWYEWSQAEAAEHFPGNRSQQYVSDLEQKADVDEPELQEAATAYGVTPAFIRNIKDSALGTMVFNTHDSSIGHFGQHNTNNIHPLEELLKAKEENKQLYERLLAAKEAEIAELKAQLKNK